MPHYELFVEKLPKDTYVDYPKIKVCEYDGWAADICTELGPQMTKILKLLLN